MLIYCQYICIAYYMAFKKTITSKRTNGEHNSLNQSCTVKQICPPLFHAMYFLELLKFYIMVI